MKFLYSNEVYLQKSLFQGYFIIIKFIWLILFQNNSNT